MNSPAASSTQITGRSISGVRTTLVIRRKSSMPSVMYVIRLGKERSMFSDDKMTPAIWINR